MIWTILLIKKSDNGWFINYIENKLINQIIKNNLQNYIDVIIFEPNINITCDFISVIDYLMDKAYIEQIDISDNFISNIYAIISTRNCEGVGIKGIVKANDELMVFNNISKKDNEVFLPITKLNPIKFNLITKKFPNILHYINSQVLLNVVHTVTHVSDPIVYLEKITKKIPISIIVTAYKTQNYIEECLDSIENQTYFINNDDFEVLVGVDACEDTLNKLQEIKHKYRNLHIYMMSENKGTYITTNTLIDLMKYDDAIRFDSDDIMTPNLVNEVIKDKNDSDLVLLGSVDYQNSRVGNKLLMTEGVIYFKKNVMDNIAGGYQPWRCAGDTELIRRIVNKVKITQIKKALFYRRLHSDSLTQRPDTGYLSDLRKEYKKQIKPVYKDSEIKIERIVNNIIENNLDNLILNNDKLININEYFDHIYCLNLDRRIDKWLIMKKKLDKLNIKAFRFSAIDGNNLSDDIINKHNKLSKGAIGCMLSYYEIIKDAKENNYENILIFEDDVIFDKNFQKKFSEKILDINKWKILHLGASQYDWSNINFIDNFYYSKDTQGTFSIAFNSDIYDEILQTYDIVNIPIDAKLCSIQKKYYGNCYTFYPNLTIADISSSDIRDKRDINIHSKKMRWNLDLYDMNNSLKILLCVDIPNWAFDNIANAIIKYNTYSFIQYTKVFLRGSNFVKTEFNYNDWDYVFVFFEGDKNIPINKNKLISGCYSAIWLESNILTKDYLINRFNNCRATIFVNDDIKNEILQYCENIDYTVINDAADPNEFYRDDSIKKYEKFTVLFVGNTNREIKRFNSIKRICEKSEVNLEVVTNISHNELYKEYNKAHLSINFSVSEGGPQTFFESSLCETPMLINSDISMSKKIPCFSSNTEDGMIKIIKELKNNYNKCIIKGKEARDVVLKNYTYEKSANKFSNFFFEIAKKDIIYNNNLTVFVISSGENPNFDDCINALKKQTIQCKIEIIKNYSPSSRAFQEMINRCKTRYYIQVDEDMILFPNALEKMYESIANSKNKDVMIAHPLYDVHLDFNIIGIKIFDHSVYKKYPYDTNLNSNKIPTIEQLERIQNDGYTARVLSLENKNLVGEHSPKWTTELIFERYFDLMEKYKIYGYSWMKELPEKLKKIWENNPNDINYFAMMGAKISIENGVIRKTQKNYTIKNEYYLKVKNNYKKNV